MYLMNILVPGMLYHGPVVRQVLSWADVRRPPAPCGSGCHRAWYQSSQAGIGYPSIRSPLPLTGNGPKGFDPSLASGMATVNQQVAQSGPTRPHPAVPA